MNCVEVERCHVMISEIFLLVMKMARTDPVHRKDLSEEERTWAFLVFPRFEGGNYHQRHHHHYHYQHYHHQHYPQHSRCYLHHQHFQPLQSLLILKYYLFGTRKIRRCSTEGELLSEDEEENIVEEQKTQKRGCFPIPFGHHK